MEELLSTADVARLYGVSAATIRLWIRKGAIAYVAVGNSKLRQRRTIRIPREEAEKHLGPMCNPDASPSSRKGIPSELLSKVKNEDQTYLVRDKDWNLKIGFSRDVCFRVSSMQTDHAEPIVLVGLLDGNHEKELHRRFGHLRIRGEWFMYDEVIVDAFDVADGLRKIKDEVGKLRPKTILEATSTL